MQIPPTSHRSFGLWAGVRLVGLRAGLGLVGLRAGLRLVGIFVVSAALGASVAWLPRGSAPLLEVRLPDPGAEFGVEGVPVLIGFPDQGRVEIATLRVLLNGADVTDSLRIAGNGAHGSLHGLLDGENEIAVEVFGHSHWPGRWLVEERAVRRVRFRRPLDTDRG